MRTRKELEETKIKLKEVSDFWKDKDKSEGFMEGKAEGDIGVG